MRLLSSALFVVMISSALGAGAAQSDQKSRVPRNGDEVVVKGCLKGAMLEASETMLADGSGSVSTPYTFQLKGKKELLKRLREEYDGSFVELKGQLKSSLDARRGAQIGRTGIYVGTGNPTDRPGLGNDRIMPVLDVKSYEGSGARCRR